MFGRRYTRWWKALAVAGAVFFGAIQLVPYAHDQVNPAVVAEPEWDTPETLALARRACFDCHSNETVWPLYTKVAPASWLIYRDVVEGRETVNFSEWQRPQREAVEAADIVLGRMPPLSYRILHPEARLTAAERERLSRGLANTIGADLPGGGP